MLGLFGSLGAPKKAALSATTACARSPGCTCTSAGRLHVRGSGWRHVVSRVCSCVQKSFPPYSTERCTNHGESGIRSKRGLVRVRVRVKMSGEGAGEGEGEGSCRLRLPVLS